IGGFVLSRRPYAPRSINPDSVGISFRNTSNISFGGAESRPTTKTFCDNAIVPPCGIETARVDGNSGPAWNRNLMRIQSRPQRAIDFAPSESRVLQPHRVQAALRRGSRPRR